ncbi:hypothetical protein jhhlp_004576, partial [Lomentospora prolificans]
LTATNRDRSHQQPQSDMPQETELLATDQNAQQSIGKGKALLHVPSRTSSQKHQSSPTASGLSGVTANDSRQSLGEFSKESESMRTRQRNGSASSRRSGGDTEPTTTPINSQPSSPAAAPHKKKKSGGLLSLLGCCGVPDAANSGEGSEENVHKLDKLPNRPGSSRPTAHTPSDQQPTVNVNKRLNEKAFATDAASKEVIPKDKRASNTSTHDQSTVVGERPERESKQSTVPAPSVHVQPPNNGSATEPSPNSQEATTNNAKDEEGDITMADASAEEHEPQPPEPHQEEQLPQQPSEHEAHTDEPVAQIPPPPSRPGPSTDVTAAPVDDAPETSDFAPEPQQISLLPPIRPEHKGRKCLVLDLDETLVHSSFKILHQADFTIPVEIEGNYHNVYVIKRPGVDEFMKRVGELYEVVVFTASVSKYGDPLLDQLDIHKVVHHRLFRESCYNHQGNYVKDLSQVGRPLKDTIIIDNSPTSYIFHPQHALPISSWFSDAHDNELMDLIPVLEDLAGSTVRDVSLVLDVTL